jgi:hypothetical protein
VHLKHQFLLPAQNRQNLKKHRRELFLINRFTWRAAILQNAQAGSRPEAPIGLPPVAGNSAPPAQLPKYLSQRDDRRTDVDRQASVMPYRLPARHIPRLGSREVRNPNQWPNMMVFGL